MLNTTLEEQDFFTSHGLMSDPGRFANLLQDLPSDLPSLVKSVQGLFPFDNLGVPHDQFLTGGRAWQMACLEGVDPFGFEEVVLGNGAAQ